jgi:hypothetical protein
MHSSGLLAANRPSRWKQGVNTHRLGMNLRFPRTSHREFRFPLAEEPSSHPGTLMSMSKAAAHHRDILAAR